MELKISTPYFILKRKLKNKGVIFVDYFDTVAYRFVHPSKLCLQWAKVLLYKYPELSCSVNDLVVVRKNAEALLSTQYEEPPYEKVMGLVYGNIKLGGITENEFIKESLKIDVAIEIGCQYPNRRFVELLKKQKEKGKKIYLVSDFYLPEDVYFKFLSNIQCSNLFDGVYVSEKYNKTKRRGSLYKYVLKDLNIDSSCVAMIGDNKQADYIAANDNGICGILKFSYIQKIKRVIGKKIKQNYQKQLGKELYKYSIFREYVIVLYHVISKMYLNAKSNNEKSLAFISRGGYFLQQLFDSYQNIIIRDFEKIKTTYMLNSRKVCVAAYQDFQNGGGRNLDLFKEYTNNYVKDGKISIVDEGWYHRSQTHIAEIMGCDTNGYYVGSRRKPLIGSGNKHYIKGMLFDMQECGKESKYYGIFCTNCSIYEQMLTAPHGSVDSFKRNVNGNVDVICKENAKENFLYTKYIKPLQDDMLLRFSGLCVWMVGTKISEKELAKMVLKSVLFANNDRCDFLNVLDKNRYDNCTAGRLQDKGIKQVKINPIELVFHPDRYVGMFCKIQRRLRGRFLLEIAYYPFAILFYLYVRILTI